MTQNKLLQVQVLNLFIVLLVCIVSLVIASFYTGGDQAHYNDFYSIAQVINLNEIIIVRPLHSKPNQNTQISPYIQCFDTHS